MKKGIIFLVLVLLGFQQSSSVFASELTDDYFDIATNYFNTNNYAKALEYLDTIMEFEPDNLQAKTLRDKISPLPKDSAKIALENAQSPDKAQNPPNFVILNVSQADVEKMSYNSDYYNTKGQEFYQKKEYDTAIEYFYKSIKLDSRNAQAYNNLAMAYWIKNDFISAIKYFRKANWINRCYSLPLVNLGMLYKQLGDENKQVYYLKRATIVNPNDYLAYYHLGDYYRNKGYYPLAIENYKEVVKINPKYPQVYLNLAMCFFETEEFNYTALALSQYRDFCPDTDFEFYLMARAELATGHYEDAKIYIQKAIEICDRSEYQFELAKIEYYLENYQLALDSFQKLLTTNNSAEMFNYVGLCNYKLKNIEAAIANFNKAINLDTLRPIYFYNLAQCYKSLGDKRNYQKYATTATKITPINYQDFIDLSYIYYDNSNPSYAINSLNSAISRYPNVKALYLSKLKIYEALGDNLHYNETRDLINERFNKK